MQVEIDLDLNAYANARAHFESRKAKAAKQQKTVEQNAKALLAAEKTAQQKLTQVSCPPLSGITTSSDMPMIRVICLVNAEGQFS